MHERDLRREEAEVRGKIIEKKKESTTAEKKDQDKPGDGWLQEGEGLLDLAQ